MDDKVSSELADEQQRLPSQTRIAPELDRWESLQAQVDLLARRFKVAEEQVVGTVTNVQRLLEAMEIMAVKIKELMDAADAAKMRMADLETQVETLAGAGEDHAADLTAGGGPC